MESCAIDKTITWISILHLLVNVSHNSLFLIYVSAQILLGTSCVSSFWQERALCRRPLLFCHFSKANVKPGTPPPPPAPMLYSSLAKHTFQIFWSHNECLPNLWVLSVIQRSRMSQVINKWSDLFPSFSLNNLLNKLCEHIVSKESFWGVSQPTYNGE